MRSLKDVLANDYGLDLNGWNLVAATGISANGMVIVGSGSYNGQVGAWVATLPESATLSLLALGGLAVLSRRRG